jgi:hypothetical protein
VPNSYRFEVETTWIEPATSWLQTSERPIVGARGARDRYHRAANDGGAIIGGEEERRSMPEARLGIALLCLVPWLVWELFFPHPIDLTA